MSDNSRWRTVFSFDNRLNHREWVERGFIGEGRINVEDTDLSDAGRIVKGGFRGGTFDRIRLVRCNLEHSDFTNSTFYSSEIIECVWNRSDIYGCRFNEATLENCDFVNVEFTRPKFVQTRIQGGDWSNSHLELPTFTEATVKNINFHKSHFPDARMYSTRFINCDFRDADFTYAEPSKAHFENCDFRGTNFKHCQLKDTTFKQCGFYGCYDTPEFLGEVTIIAPDLSEDFDGSKIVEPEQIISLWQNNPPAPPPPPEPVKPAPPPITLEELIEWAKDDNRPERTFNTLELKYRVLALDAVEVLIDRFIHEAIDLMEGLPEQDDPFSDWEYVFDEFEEGDYMGYAYAIPYWFPVKDGKPNDEQIDEKLRIYGVNMETPSRRDMFYRYFVAHRASEKIKSILSWLDFYRPPSKEIAEAEIKRLEQIWENSILGETRAKLYIEESIKKIKEWFPILENNIPGEHKNELSIKNYLQNRKESLSTTDKSSNSSKPTGENQAQLSSIDTEDKPELLTQTDEAKQSEAIEEKGVLQLQQELDSDKQKLTELGSQLGKVEERIIQARKTNIFGRKQSGENEREKDRLVREIKDIKDRIAARESAIAALKEQTENGLN